MNIETFVAYCLEKKGTEETLPFGPETLVLKVMGKMFALCPLDSDRFSIALKCDPDYALELRERHPEIEGAYHMNKKHWNSIQCEGSLSDALLKSLIDHSYDLVVKGLKKSERATFLSL